MVMAGENLSKEHLKTRDFSPVSEALAPLWEDFWHHPCAVQLALIEFMDKLQNNLQCISLSVS